MITAEWQRLLSGEEQFMDADAEEIAKKIMSLMESETDPIKLVQLTNDLEKVLGSVEWLTRKAERLKELLHDETLSEEERSFIEDKINRVLGRRDVVLKELRQRYD